MLSLKASRADNFYYGSIEDEKDKKKKEKKEKRLNRKDYDDIKFEVPYTIICKKCNKYIYKGERFKSERRKIGFYINSTFYSFCIVCKNCLNEIVFETNPQNCSYDIIQGARQKNEKYENILTHKGKKNINSINFEDNKKKKINPFLLLEQNVVQNKKKGLSDCTTFENYNQSKHIITNNNKEDIFEEGKENDQKYDYDKNSVENDTYPLSQHNKNILITYKKNECEQRDNNSVVSNEEFNIISPQKNDEDSNISSDDEDMNEVIKNNYKRNHILKYDFSCNSHLRKQLRNIKKEDIKKKEQCKKKNIFIDLINDPLEDIKVKHFALLKDKYKKNITDKNNTLKNNLIKKKKNSIFDKRYLKEKKKKIK
ncbi:hypothetical protein PFHG_01033 [Plasmodium falciparum HB3]|uniref:CWC16 domain-containing protein n=1 Tax=Plasmodium falciparum (isolate HB3) TaxID=137071 RepID=A0A0L7K7L4_PLAFX|nr:hypothetical protein PFHG_01033 [Plasmodium falciparum HB3]